MVADCTSVLADLFSYLIETESIKEKPKRQYIFKLTIKYIDNIMGRNLKKKGNLI